MVREQIECRKEIITSVGYILYSFSVYAYYLHAHGSEKKSKVIISLSLKLQSY